MLSLARFPRLIDSDCHQISCYFDKSLYHDGLASSLGLALPPSLEIAVPKRKAEFVAGRYCAREALMQLDSKLDTAIGIGSHREPLWPKSVVGSITHTGGFASAMVAHRTKIRAIGIDSELWIDLSKEPNLKDHILTVREDFNDQELLALSPAHYLTLVFSAKESLYKCLFPLVNRFFHFQSAAITLQPSEINSEGEFRFELLEDLNAEFCKGYCGHGRYFICDRIAHTAVVLKS